MEAIFAKEVGTIAYLRIYWGSGCPKFGCHNAMERIADTPVLGDFGLDTPFGGRVEDYQPDDWAKYCKDCGIPVPHDGSEELNYQIHRKRLYNTPDGTLGAGNLYWNSWLPENFYWDNHKGAHLMAVLPNGTEWNIDSRASNCTMKEDKNHRCWCRKGNPETEPVTVDKNGNTCQAGGGSILVDDYHGFLRNGKFT